MNHDNLLKTAESLFKTKLIPTQVSLLLHLLDGTKPKRIVAVSAKCDITTNGLMHHVRKFVESGHILREGSYLRLTEKGRIYAKALCTAIEFKKEAA